MYYVLMLGELLESMLVKKVWKYINSNQMERFAQKVFIILRTLTVITEDLRGWMQRFNSVATKYLDNYLAWFKILEGINHQNNKINIIVRLAFYTEKLSLNRRSCSKEIMLLTGAIIA